MNVTVRALRLPTGVYPACGAAARDRRHSTGLSQRPRLRRRHRYVTEDTELGLAFLASAARFAGVDAPVAHGLLAIVGGFLGRDLRRGPRTLEALGLAGLDRQTLRQRLTDGA